LRYPLDKLMSEFTEPLPLIGALRAFESAARHLSFTEAAAEIGRTQSAISHQIRELENRLDTKLFQRKARGIVLSEAGRTYLPFAKEALARLRAGSEALRQSSNDSVLTVSCSPNFASK
jgi:LysR family glycine cleavage system transcriptional activator